MQEKHAERPNLEQYSDVPLFNTKAVVQQTGITAPTLRAWERRYTLLAPERARNAYRLYSERDIATIRWLKERVDAGISISQAIALYHYLTEARDWQQHAAFSQPTPQLTAEADRKGNTEQSSQVTYDMLIVRERLLDAFSELDEAAAHRFMAPMLAIYPIEQVCSELITPTLWEVGRRWERGQITVTVEHFASTFFQGILTNLLHAMPPGNAPPLVITCCAPGEAHAIAPLILALLLRRAGLRVAYLGQNIETEGLLQTARQLSPALLCVSITLASFLEALIDMGQKIQELPAPRPVLVCGGQLFEQRPDLAAQVPGVYLAGEMEAVIPQLTRMAYAGLPFS
jgi:MerR family transcriptional regulator, light-induced transcriptional regulator